jgi:hypothetical protein
MKKLTTIAVAALLMSAVSAGAQTSGNNPSAQPNATPAPATRQNQEPMVRGGNTGNNTGSSSTTGARTTAPADPAGGDGKRGPAPSNTPGGGGGAGSN